MTYTEAIRILEQEINYPPTSRLEEAILLASIALKDTARLRKERDAAIKEKAEMAAEKEQLDKALEAACHTMAYDEEVEVCDNCPYLTANHDECDGLRNEQTVYCVRVMKKYFIENANQGECFDEK